MKYPDIAGAVTSKSIKENENTAIFLLKTPVCLAARKRDRYLPMRRSSSSLELVKPENRVKGGRAERIGQSGATSLLCFFLKTTNGHVLRQFEFEIDKSIIEKKISAGEFFKKEGQKIKMEGSRIEAIRGN
ncbi:MAG: hypothetical protein HY954_05340 [Deltaproteobacteria bacterium]|nr:hypothetical protein [Deltaproteobacteria bacterium]